MEQVRVPEVAPRVRGHRQRGHDDSELGHGLVEPALRRIQCAKRVVRIDEIGVKRERLPVGVDCLVDAVLALVKAPELVIAVGPLGRAGGVQRGLDRQR